MVFAHNLYISLHISSVKYRARLLPSRKETEKETLVGWGGLVLVMDAVRLGSMRLLLVSHFLLSGL